MKITRFEDIDAWKSSRRLSRQIENATESGRFCRDSDLKSQIRRASRSAIANIAEGSNSGSDPEFARFLRISRRSATEVQSHLYFALDRGVIDQEEFNHLYERTEEVKKLLGGFIRYLTVPRGLGRRRTTQD